MPVPVSSVVTNPSCGVTVRLDTDRLPTFCSGLESASAQSEFTVRPPTVSLRPAISKRPAPLMETLTASPSMLVLLPV